MQSGGDESGIGAAEGGGVCREGMCREGMYRDLRHARASSAMEQRVSARALVVVAKPLRHCAETNSAARLHGWRMQPGVLAAASSCEGHGRGQF